MQQGRQPSTRKLIQAIALFGLRPDFKKASSETQAAEFGLFEE